jgi:Druantia protein DruA
MLEKWRYRGQTIGAEQIVSLRQFIAEHAHLSRWKLSRELCEAWGWKQPNGAPRDVICRGLLLMLERAGEIELPPVRCQIRGQCRSARARPNPVLIDTTPLRAPLAALGPIEIQPVRRTADEPLFNSLLEEYHYLKYEQPIGEHLKYLVWAQARPVACLAWSSAPRHLGARDRFIGWGPTARKRNIHLIAYSTRFLILPWVRIEHLASHILGRMARRISADWERVYAHPIYMLETFVDPVRFRGTCYRAANWVVLGRTTGRGKDDQTHRPNRSIKEVLGLPLHRRFRELLGR